VRFFGAFFKLEHFQVFLAGQKYLVLVFSGRKRFSLKNRLFFFDLWEILDILRTRFAKFMRGIPTKKGH